MENARFSANCKMFVSEDCGTWPDCAQRYFGLYERLLQ